MTRRENNKHLYSIATSVTARVKGEMQSSGFFSLPPTASRLPLNKKSYSSSRFPILDEAAPTFLSGRGWMAEECGPEMSLYAGKQIVGEGCTETLRQFWMSRRESWPQKGGERAPNSAEGGEESLRCACLPRGVAPQPACQQRVVQLSGTNE